MQVSPFEGCGAIVSGLQLATMTDADLTELRTAFSQHGVLFFRDQILPPKEHLRFARRFGKIVVIHYDYPGGAKLQSYKKCTNRDG